MIEGYGAPDINTPGNVGSLYRDLNNNTIYKCAGMNSEPVWKQFVSVRAHVPTTQYTWEEEQKITFPDDGKTRFLMQIEEGLLDSALTFTLSDDCAGTIDWGDGTVEPLASRNPHTYQKSGEYMVTVDVTNGTIEIPSYFAVQYAGGLVSSYARQGDHGSLQVKQCSIGRTTTIATSAFTGLSNLQAVELKNSITGIPNRAFNECHSLRSVEMPNTITSIGDYAFYNCYSLHVTEIPNTVTSIGSNAFSGCWSITNVDIPSGVSVIENASFNSCHSLKSISIPEGVTTIESSAFSGNTRLESITFPSSVTSIGEIALYLTPVKSIYAKSLIPPTLTQHVALGWPFPSGIPIYVPAESIDAYKEAEGWSYYSGMIQAMP